jgi:hypothetical protein
MTYGGEETVKVIINPDGTLEITLNDFAERDAQTEIDEIVNLLNGAGMSASVSDTKIQYTGEYHKHTHSHGVYEHSH